MRRRRIRRGREPRQFALAVVVDGQDLGLGAPALEAVREDGGPREQAQPVHAAPRAAALALGEHLEHVAVHEAQRGDDEAAGDRQHGALVAQATATAAAADDAVRRAERPQGEGQPPAR